MSELVGSVCIGVADLITDGIACTRLLRGDFPVGEKYETAYVTILCFGVVTTVLSVTYRLRNARLVRAHLRKLGEQGLQGRSVVRASASRRQAQQHEWELGQTHRTKVILSLALLSVAAQGTMPLRAGARACRCERAAGAWCGCRYRFADVHHQLFPHLFIRGY